MNQLKECGTRLEIKHYKEYKEKVAEVVHSLGSQIICLTGRPPTKQLTDAHISIVAEQLVATVQELIRADKILLAVILCETSATFWKTSNSADRFPGVVKCEKHLYEIAEKIVEQCSSLKNVAVYFVFPLMCEMKNHLRALCGVDNSEKYLAVEACNGHVNAAKTILFKERSWCLIS